MEKILGSSLLSLYHYSILLLFIIILILVLTTKPDPLPLSSTPTLRTTASKIPIFLSLSFSIFFISPPTFFCTLRTSFPIYFRSSCELYLAGGGVVLGLSSVSSKLSLGFFFPEHHNSTGDLYQLYFIN